MPLSAQDIYRSPNGDCWRLIRDPATGRRFVRHEPNAASGGRMTDTELDDFLSINGAGPEYAGLREILLGELQKQPVAPAKDSAGIVSKVGGSTPTPAVPDGTSSDTERTEEDEKVQRTGLPGG